MAGMGKAELRHDRVFRQHHTSDRIGVQRGSGFQATGPRETRWRGAQDLKMSGRRGAGVQSAAGLRAVLP